MTWRPSNRERTLRTIELLDIQPGHRVLKADFGPGLGIEAAARGVGSGCVGGVDHSDVMVRAATRRDIQAIGRGQVVLHLGSVDSLLPATEQFDRIFAVIVHMFWKDPEQTLALLRDRLVPGGILAITFQPRKMGATSSDTHRASARLEQLFDAVEFAQIQPRILPLQPVPAVCVTGTTGA